MGVAEYKQKIEELQNQISSLNSQLNSARDEAQRERDKVRSKEDELKNKSNEKERLDAQRARDALQKQKLELQETLMKFQMEENKRNLEKQNKKIKEKNENDINSFRRNQNISVFLELIEKFSFDQYYLFKTLEAINESTIINKYLEINNNNNGKIEIIKGVINGNYKIDQSCIKKLMIILLCNGKKNNECDKVFKEFIVKNNNKKELLFDILLDYTGIFCKDISFEDEEIYKELVTYSLEKRKYLESLKYREFDIIQLKLLYSHREKIYKFGIKIIFLKSNDYDEAFKVIEELIKYEKEKGKKFIFFPKEFWEKYQIHYDKNEDEDNKIQKMKELYRLLLSYIALGKDDSNYKEILAEKIHEIIKNKIEKINVFKEQIDLLLKNDPYYIYDCYDRNPNIFEKINIYDLQKEEDIEYFKNIDFEKIYINSFINFLETIIQNIRNIKDFNSILDLISLKEAKNRENYINLLIKRYERFRQEELTEESFINLLGKTIDYTPMIKLKLLEDSLPRFKQNNNLYLKILETFNTDENISKKVADLSYRLLDLLILINLIKNIKGEIKRQYFDNLSQNVITYEDFFKFEESRNLKLLIELMKNKLITESIYLDKNKEILEIIYDKLTNFDEKKEIYLDTLINEKEIIQKIYVKRFDLFKLIKGDQFDSLEEFNSIRDKFIQIKQNLEKAFEISNLLSSYYKVTLKEKLEEINYIYKLYLDKDNKAFTWIKEEEKIIKFIRSYDKKSDLIKIIKEIKLFQIIYKEFSDGDETKKFDESKKLLDECKTVFKDIDKGNINILDRWRGGFENDKGIKEELKKMKDYYKINNEEDFDKIAKNILIFTKKNIYHSDIKRLLYFIKLFQSEETELTKILNEKNLEFEDRENLNFKKLENTNNYLEEKKIYINEGKEDSSLIRFIRLLYNKEIEINFIKDKDVDSASALLYRLNPTTDSLNFKDILEYQSCIAFIHDIKAKMADDKLLVKIEEKLSKNKINQVLESFKNYFVNYSSIKSLDSNFDNAKGIYKNIKDILNNSKFELKFFKREFKVFDNDKKEIDIIAKDLDGLIQLKDNINLNFEDLSENNKVNEKQKIEINEKKNKIEIFVRYINQLQTINKYFSLLESKGCPFLIDIVVITSKDEIIYELVNKRLKYNILILNLKEYCNTIVEYQLKFYKENEYFRYVYDKQLYRLFKRMTIENKDISSYIRFFTNGDSTKDDVPLYDSHFGDLSQAYKYYREVIEEKFDLISKYIEHIFTINNTSLEKLYKNIKVKDKYNLKGIYKCNIQKYNMDLFIIKMFLKLTGTFPIAQNILLTNIETSTGEIYSFMYRAIKCRFNTLFIISISDDFSIQNVNNMTSLMNKIISDMKKEEEIEKIDDLKPCILFIIQNQNILGKSRGIIDLPEINDLSEYLKGDENKLEYDLGNDNNSLENNKSLENEIYNTVKIYTSDYSGLGKSYLIKQDIKDKGEEYHYFGIGDDISKNELFKKLKRFLKREIKNKFDIGIHLDLFFTKNIPLMKYFLFAMLITKLYQANNNILYIPKNINIYVEIPNGPHQFLDDYPILKIFKRTNITLGEKIPLDIDNEKILNKLLWTNENINIKDKDNIIKQINLDNNTYIETKIYLDIIYYLSSDVEEDKINYYEKAKNIAKHFTKCLFSQKLRIKDIPKKDKTQEEIEKYILDSQYFKEDEALKIQYYSPIIFKTKNNEFIEINISDEEVKDKGIDYFLENLKKIMSLKETIEEIKQMLGSYKITEDNYKKMILILFRIFANIPVILMGETGCGKTELIKQLMKMLNKDRDKKNQNFIIKNMHSGVKESEIIEVIEKAEKNLEESKNDLLCIFFDEINTTSLLSKMKEIFVNHSLNGKKIDQRIRFIGACNPFRNVEDKENDEGLKFENEEKTAYLVNPMPNSLLYYVFYFKSLDDEDTKKYIESIIGEEFPEGENKDSENSILRNKAIISIYESHKFVRENNGESSVSLRDLKRFEKAYKFFNEYYKYKNEFLLNMGKKISDKVDIKSKVQSFVLSLFITYYIKIFKSGYNEKYLQKINVHIKDLADKFKIKEWLDDQNWRKQIFMNLIIEEEDFLLEEMEVRNEKGIGLNTSLKENIFLMFFSIYANIPLIVVGKPGCSKSLSIQLIIRIMRGEFSDSNFLKKYPKINSTGFQGSETNTPESIENIFKEAEKKIDTSQKKKIISLLVFDELGLSEKSPTNCLKVLHSKLEMSLDPNEQNQLSFIGISNWRLDAAKMNRAIFLAIPDIKLPDVGLTVEAIAKSYADNIYDKYEAQYLLLGNTFFNYKEKLKKENDEFITNFHGGRDLYNLVKVFSSDMMKYNLPSDPKIIDKAVKNSLARNLSGLEINGKSSLKKYITNINFDDLKTMDLIKENILSEDTRFLLLAAEKSMFSFLLDIIKKELEEMNKMDNSSDSNNEKINYVSYIGSPFKGDKMNISYQTEMIVNIENSVAEGKVIILSDLDQIYSIFYDLFNQNYIMKDGKKYCRISHGANIQKLAFVNDKTKFIIMVDKNNIRQQKLPFLSRFEKHIITFDSLLNEKDKEKSKIINSLLKKTINVKDINYNMDNILVNINEDIINGYVYLYRNKENNSYKNIIKDKIIPILPQDIIFTLPFSDLERNELELLKNDIFLNDRYYSLEEYLKSDKRGKEYILLVYTFSDISLSINLSEKEKFMERVASQINNVYKFKQLLHEFYEKKSCGTLILKFDNEKAKYINFFISEINHYKNINKINDNNKKYIFIIGVQREFNNEKKNVNKITTVLIIDDSINQLFIDNIDNNDKIDNIDGTKLSIKDIEGKIIDDYINNGYLNPKKLISEGMKDFFGENNNEKIGKCKGISTTNFMEKLIDFIENSNELTNDIKRIILSKINNSEKIIDSIIKNKSINQNTIDFITAIITYVKDIFNDNLKIFLRKTENNNFFTTIFILNIRDDEKKNEKKSFDELIDYSFSISDADILKNEIIIKIKQEFLKAIREEKNEINVEIPINIKLIYKIPGFFNVYKEIKDYIENEKISFYYRQNESDLRKCDFEFISLSVNKLREDIKEFNDKLYTKLKSIQIVSKVIETKITDKNYIEFIELFFNDYITFYLVNLYHNKINDFIINDIPHKIVLMLLDLKFKELKEEEKYRIPLQNLISKILWLEGNSKYIKNILDLYNIISENILYHNEEKDILFKNMLYYLSKNEIKYEPKEPKLLKVNIPYYIIIIILFKCMVDDKSIKNANLKNDNYYSFFKELEKCLKEMQKLDKILKLNIKELSVLNEFIYIYDVYEHSGKINNLDINKLIYK